MYQNIIKMWGTTNECQSLSKENELLYFTAYAIWTAWYILAKSSLYGMVIFNGISGKLVRGICVVILLYKMICCDRYKVKELDIIAAVGIVAFISVLFSREIIIAYILLLVIASKNIPFKKIVKFSLVEISLFVLFIVFSSKIGIIENYVYYRPDGTIRNSFGFGFTLFLGAYYLNIVLMYLYLKNKYTKYFEYLILIAINFFIYKRTDNRSVYLFVYFSIILTVIFTKIKIPEKLKRIFNQIFSYSVPFCAVFSIVISLLYDPSKPWYVKLDEILEGRLSLGKRAYLNYGLHLFGNKVTFVGFGGANYYSGNVSTADYNYVDCSYLQVALRYGIIILIVLCIAYAFLCVKEVKQQNTLLCIFILTMALQGMINDQFILPPYNIFLLAIGELFSKTGSLVNVDANNNIEVS